MEHTVTGCKDCIMLNFNPEIGCKCKHPISPNDNEVAYEYYDIVHGHGSPDWCPLNKEPITIVKSE